MKKRNTPAKQAVLSVLKASKTALSQENIEQATKGAMDRVTIYRILSSFMEDGLVHRIISEDGKQYFAICLNCEEHRHHHDHFHFRCLQCGQIECLKEEVKVTVPAGYQLESVNCILSGYCPACA